MSANTAPIFLAKPISKFTKLSEANTNDDGTGAVQTIYTSGENGAFLDFINMSPKVQTTDTEVKIFLNNGSDQTDPNNNYLLKASAIEWQGKASDSIVKIPLNVLIEPNMKVNIAVTVAQSTPIDAILYGGEY